MEPTAPWGLLMTRSPFEFGPWRRSSVSWKYVLSQLPSREAKHDVNRMEIDVEQNDRTPFPPSPKATMFPLFSLVVSFCNAGEK